MTPPHTPHLYSILIYTLAPPPNFAQINFGCAGAGLQSPNGLSDEGRAPFYFSARPLFKINVTFYNSARPLCKINVTFYDSARPLSKINVAFYNSARPLSNINVAFYNSARPLGKINVMFYNSARPTLSRELSK